MTPKGQFDYGIEANSTGAEYFNVDSKTGRMTIARPLSGDTRTRYFLIVTATDRGTPSQTGKASVTITVTRNEKCPVFQDSLSVVPVPVSAQPSSTLFTASARDQDSGLNGRVTYSILPGNGAQATFDIDANTGAVSLRQALPDSRVNTTMTIKIQAADGGKPPCTTDKEFEIRFIDANAIR